MSEARRPGVEGKAPRVGSGMEAKLRAGWQPSERAERANTPSPITDMSKLMSTPLLLVGVTGHNPFSKKSILAI